MENTKELENRIDFEVKETCRKCKNENEDRKLEIIEVGDEIIELFKTQGFKYDDAYITLEHVKRKLSYMMKFTHL